MVIGELLGTYAILAAAGTVVVAGTGVAKDGKNTFSHGLSLNSFEVLADSELCGETISDEEARQPECYSEATSTRGLEVVEILEQTAFKEDAPRDPDLQKY